MNDKSLSERTQLATAWLDAQSDSLLQTLTRWCGQNSWSGNLDGLQAMTELLEADFKPLGLPCERIRLPPWESIGDVGETIQHETGPALLWHHHPEASKRVLLLIHYDTVYPPASVPNSVAMTNDGHLVGPGVADAKGGIAIIKFALQAILRFQLASDLGITVMLNPDEEVGSQSSATLFQKLAPQFDFALVFEPRLPDGAMVANRKGTANFTAVIHGRAAHAGRNLSDGRNAIVYAARLATELDRWNNHTVQLTGSSDSHISINVGKITGGGPLNQVPSLATLSVNVRVAMPDDVAAVIERMKGIEQRYSAADGFTCKVYGQFHSPPKRIDGDNKFNDLRRRFTHAAAHTGNDVVWRDTGGSCDGNKLAALGLSNLDTMGPTGGDLHSPAEYCQFTSLITAAKTLVHLIADAGHEP